ncbi:MAG TPA: LysM peptidoglycan-binding domain-containing protein [Anaerolineales bacterium]|nr:LysM peptidoglycan-binding domain-containing protein [Anaerolineales bacterium]
MAPVAGPDLLAPALATQPAATSVGATPLPARPNYRPAELVDYVAQSGDSLPELAAHFNTTVAEIRAANPIIPDDATTMPPGMPMKIPIYFKSLWATPFKIIPDAAFVDGPAEVGFNTSAFVASRPGWLKNYRAYAGYQFRSGAEIVDYVATNYSVSPRLLLALLEYKAGALSQPEPPDKPYPLDFPQPIYQHTSYLLYTQLFWAANTFNNGYYGWRSGQLTEFDLPDGTLIRPDPWQNAGSVAIEYLFSLTDAGDSYNAAIASGGLAKTYESLFGDPWKENTTLIPGSLRQPPLTLPFPPGQVWSYTGGPHTGWGAGAPFAALDFAPPSEHHGCFLPDPPDFVTAMANGVVARSGPDGVALDLDGDGDERTGWVIFYLHLSADSRAPAGKELHTGEMIGYGSCQGGELVTGTHVHIARKYNGEWLLAGGMVPFNMDGWIAHAGDAAYQGTLTRNGLQVTGCVCSDLGSQIRSDYQP